MTFPQGRMTFHDIPAEVPPAASRTRAPTRRREPRAHYVRERRSSGNGASGTMDGQGGCDALRTAPGTAQTTGATPAS